MQKSAHFRVDPKLAHVLGESYANSEKALKELIDNAWDSEATEVHVSVPTILTDAPIIAQDNGSVMKGQRQAMPAELKQNLEATHTSANSPEQPQPRLSRKMR